MKRNTRDPKSKRRRGGYPPFRPSAAERKMVREMAGLRTSWEEMRKLVINPITGRPICKTSFARIFAQELEQARAKLKQLVGRGFYLALQSGQPWALRLAMKNVFHWSLEGHLMPVLDGEDQQQRRIEVVFCTPDPAPLQTPQPLDVAPQPQPDYSKPALPPPRPRANTPFGWMEQ
jgi:hypothetical protein